MSSITTSALCYQVADTLVLCRHKDQRHKFGAPLEAVTDLWLWLLPVRVYNTSAALRHRRTQSGVVNILGATTGMERADCYTQAKRLLSSSR